MRSMRNLIILIAGGLTLCCLLGIGAYVLIKGQQQPPVVQPTTDIVETTDPQFPEAVPDWSAVHWLTQEEAVALRALPNVINIAYLDGDVIKYAAELGVNFSGQELPTAQPDLLSGQLQVSGTSVQLDYNGILYTVNMLQPLIFAEDPFAVYVVDYQGVMRGTDVSLAYMVPISQAAELLPIEIAPNPNLSIIGKP